MLAMLLAALVAAAGASAAPSFSAHGSAEQVYVTGLAANAQMSLITSGGKTLYTQDADSLGGLLFRNVPPGSGYRVWLASDGSESDPITVHSDAAKPWDPSIYNQSIPDSGYTYLTTRDGTQLAIDVHPPTSPAGVGVTSLGLPVPPGVTPPSLPITLPGLPNLPGLPSPLAKRAHVSAFGVPPYPTLIEYSGYGYADPSGPVNGIAVLANLMGFAVVDVNMRGTGCSGGAYDFFEPLQNLDAYDVIETIAHQPWVLGHKVGMMGISYGAISQLFAAQLDPPDLEAISPLSTIDATATTLYPGGILNTGFAVAWAQQRQEEAEPAGPNSGQPYAYQQIQDGDQTCKANQVMHGEAASLMDKIDANSHYVASTADPLDPITFVNKIKVPVFMACQWEDEQTGGHCPDLVQHFTGTKQKWFTFTNGAHVDSLDPDTFDRWYDFLELFVAHQHDGDRRRRGSPLGALLHTRRRPPGDGQRGAAGRQRDVRPERVAARQRAQALDQHRQHLASEEHPARADPEHAHLRRSADAQGQVRRGRHPALLRGPRLPRRLAYPGDDLSPQRHPAGVVVRSDRSVRDGSSVDPVLEEHALELDPPGGARRQRADWAAGLPELAQRAVSAVRGD